MAKEVAEMMAPTFPMNPDKPYAGLMTDEAARFVRLEFGEADPAWLVHDGFAEVAERNRRGRQLQAALRGFVARVASLLF